MRFIYFKFILRIGAISFASLSAISCSDDAENTMTSGGPGDACGPGAVLCDATCTSTELDPNNCGQCGNACADGEACQSGSCVFECNGGATDCNGSCVDMQNDPANCGECGNACDAAQEVCSAGQCVASCGSGALTRCGESCVDTMSDAANCGQCGEPCAGGSACVVGQCVVQEAPKAVYTMTNDPAGNRILAFGRAEDGSLKPSGTFADTGGRGTGGGLGNQRGLVFDPTQNLFFAVNAGDSSISMLSLQLDGSLELLSTVPSGGERPVSVTVSGSVVYVLNAGVAANGTEANISGFKIAGAELTSIADSTRPLSAANPGPAQIQFSPDGAALVVTERMTNMLSSFTVKSDIATGPFFTASGGMTPFGFDFSANGQVIVSEAQGGMANMASASSYSLGATGALTPVTSAIATTRTSACWLAVAGDYAYVANAQTDDITGLAIAADGSLTLLDADGVTGQAGDAPVDLDVTDGNDFLYVVNNGDHSFSIFQINADGSLTKKPDFIGLPTTALGIVAR